MCLKHWGKGEKPQARDTYREKTQLPRSGGRSVPMRCRTAGNQSSGHPVGIVIQFGLPGANFVFVTESRSLAAVLLLPGALGDALS